MAILDAFLLLADRQAVTATANGAGVIDLGTARDIGSGEQVNLLFTVDEAAAAAGAATVTFELLISASADLSSPSVIAASGAVPRASLVPGYSLVLPIPPQPGSRGQRYLGVRFTVGTGPLTAGKFSANIVKNVRDSDYYPIGYSQ